MSGIHHESISNRNPLVELIDVERHVGFAISVNFEEAVLLSNDYWKEMVGGLPMNSFVLASAFYSGNYAETPKIDREVLLLRVMGPADMPMDRTRIDAMIDSYTKRTQVERTRQSGHGDSFEFDQYDGFDKFTHTELQFGAIRCRIVGSFYLKDSQLMLGADIENFSAASHLRAYKPTSKALETIVNFIDPIRRMQAEKKAAELGFNEVPSPFKLGTVRYTSTDRMHRGENENLVPVGVNPIDFLARRTAVFGMTRTGKSNMIKTLSSAVGLAGKSNNVKIGQCIFDINGEYANANKQDDGSSIADVFGDSVVCYRASKPPREGFQDLRNNFYREPQVGLSIIQEQLRQVKGLANDMLILATGMSLEEPSAEEATDSDINRWKRQVELFKVLLYSVGFELPKDEKVTLGPSKPVMRQVMSVMQPSIVDLEAEKKGGKLTQDEIAALAKAHYGDLSTSTTLKSAKRFILDAREADRRIQREYDPKNKKTGFYGDRLRSDGGSDPWFDDTLKALANLIGHRSDTGTNIKCKSYLGPLSELHSISGSGEVEADIYNLLSDGKIVIVDLSVGSSSIREAISERIAREIFMKSMGIFHTGEVSPNIVLYVEEAHNLIGRDAKPDETWPRIAKEGAKANIALVYATQEPSSVQPNIMANTENWIVTHLNNDDELRVLGKFYDFADFSLSLKRAQDVGFARVKTLSSPYVVPTQIDLFVPEKIIKQLESLNQGVNDQACEFPAPTAEAKSSDLDQLLS
ncbi:hypothetical protein ACH42_01445 [Endozoicomonas sp. (ex Bugula neritina AB1)]|nr:hypothetical protein ACH42_01445 [Endozoicomonas sp. (ex Bugula neritina AB1)]